MWSDSIRRQFPFFERHPNLAYLDSASATQKPQVVIDAVTQAMTSAANAGRSGYRLARASDAAVSWRGLQVATFLPPRRMVALSQRRLTSSSLWLM